MRTAALAAAAAALPAEAQPAEVQWPASQPASLAARTVAEAALRQSVLYEKASGSLLPVSALASVFRKMDEKVPILIGEVHDQVQSHAAQLAALQMLHAESKRPMVVCFEMFYRQHNPVLDEYIDGKISLDAMLNRVDFDRSWGFDRTLYTPLFSFCRAKRIRMVGLNVPSQLVRVVSTVGLKELEKTWPRVYDLLPKDIDTSNMEHRKHFLLAMGFGSDDPVPHAHANAMDSGALMDRWYQSQCVWDTAMSENISDVVLSGDYRVVALVGSGHMETRTAIPDRTEKRCRVRPFAIVTRPVGWRNVGGVSYPDISAFERGSDLVWFTSRTQDIV